MSATPTIALNSPAHHHRARSNSLLARVMNTLVPQLRKLDRLMTRSATSLAESRAQVMRMAQSLEAREPSHAADLRAAASRDDG